MTKLDKFQSLAYNRAARELAGALEILVLVRTGSGPESWLRKQQLNAVLTALQMCAECLLDINANVVGQDTRDRLRKMCRE